MNDADNATARADVADVPSAGRWFILMLAMCTLVGPMSLHLFFPALPNVKSDLGVSEAMTQLTVSLPMFTMAFLTLVYGSLSDRMGRKPVLAGGILLFAAGSGLAVLADSIWLLLAGRVVQAAGGACGLALARAIARDVYGLDRLVQVLATLTMVYALGPTLSAPLGGWLVDLFGWRGVMSFASVAGLALAVFVFIAVSETKPAANITGAPATRRTRLGAVLADYRTLLGNPVFAGFVVQSGASSGAFYTMATGSSFLMVDYLGRSPTEYGLWFITFPGFYILGNFIAGRLGKHVSVEVMVLTSSILVAVGAILLVLFGTLVTLTPLTIFGPGALMAIAGGMGVSNAQAGAIRLAGERAGTAAGIGVFVQMMCAAVFIQVYGLAADGTPIPFLVVTTFAVTLCLAAGTVPYLYRHRIADPAL